MADEGMGNVVQPDVPQQEGSERAESRASSRAEAAAEKQALIVRLNTPNCKMNLNYVDYSLSLSKNSNNSSWKAKCSNVS